MTPAAVNELIAAGRGTQFDPRVVDVMLTHFDEGIAVRG
jgi:HD-GYP domain-containing protein (c-di-GMP phosphodiesterase class II)